MLRTISGSPRWTSVVGGIVLSTALAAHAQPPSATSAAAIPAPSFGTTVRSSLDRPAPVTFIPTRDGRSYATLAVTAGCSGPFNRIIPVAANTVGVGTSRWKTNIGLYADAAASVDIAVLPKNQANPNPATVNVQVPANEEVILENVLGSLFQAANAGLGIRFCSGFPLVESYFYNTGGAPGIVYGATVPALDETQATRPWRPAYFHNLSFTPSAIKGTRVNIGATSNSNFNVDMVIDIYDGPTLLGHIDHTLLPYEHRQYTNVHQIIGAPAVVSGHAVVRVLTDNAEVYSFAQQVQNKSGDLVYEQANLAPAPVGPIADIFDGTWTGTWHNLTFGSSGSVSWTITINRDATESAPSALALAGAAAQRMPPGVLGAGGVKDALLGIVLPPDRFASINMSFGGNVFGGGPKTGNLFGRKSRGAIWFNGDDTSLGHYDFWAGPTGYLGGTLTNIPSTNVRYYRLMGEISNKQIRWDNVIGLQPSGEATGNATLTAPPGPSPTPGL